MGTVDLFTGTLNFAVFSAVGLGIVTLTRAHRETLCFQFRLFLVAIILRFLMALIVYELGLIDVIKDEDGSGWVVGSFYKLQWEREGLGPDAVITLMRKAYNDTNKGYFYLTGYLYYFIDPERLTVAALNCLVGALTTVYSYRLTRSLYSERSARLVAFWMCVLPSLVFWSAQTIKEPVVILLEILAIYGAVKVSARQGTLRYLALAVASSFLTIPFRFYAVYVTGLALAGALVFPATSTWRLRLHPALLCGIALVLSATLISLAGRSSRSDVVDLRYLEGIKQWGALGNSGVTSGYDLGSAEGIGINLLFGSVHVLLAPFPWQLASGSVRMLMVGPEMLFWWWLLYRGISAGVLQEIRGEPARVLPLLIFVLGFGILYSMTFSNVGLVYRQRAQLYPVLLVFGARGLEMRKSRQECVADALPCSANTLVAGDGHASLTVASAAKY